MYTLPIFFYLLRSLFIKQILLFFYPIISQDRINITILEETYLLYILLNYFNQKINYLFHHYNQNFKLNV